MMKFKKLASLTMALILGTSAFAMSGCGKEKVSGDNALDVYICELGNGRMWLDEALEVFAEKDYVKEKYPNFKKDVSANSEYNYGQEQLRSGVTSFDLLFTSTFSPATVEEPGKDGKKSILEDLTDIYNSKIIDFNGGYEKNTNGEEWTYAEKMKAADPNLLKTIGFGEETADGDYETHYYYTVGGTSIYGILYNKTKLVEYGFLTVDGDGNVQGLPRTTEELKKFASDIKEKGYCPFIAAKDTGYWTRVQNLWWAQYEGAEAYDQYFQGKYKNSEGEWVRGVEVLNKAEGRRIANKVTEDLLWYENGLIHKDSSALNFTEAQTRLIKGDGLMQANGTWFDNEMKSTSSQEGADAEIRMMPIPIISDIIKVVPDKSITDDAELSALVKAIDGGATSFDGVTQKDFNRVMEAYNLYNTGEAFSPIVIPSYSDATELAKDFIRFMATDEFARIYAKNTGGGSTSFYFDVEKEDPELYNTFSGMQKDRIQFVKGKSSILCYKTSNYQIVYRTSYANLGKGFELSYMSENKSDRKTSKDCIDEQIAEFTRNWDMMLSQAGLK